MTQDLSPRRADSPWQDRFAVLVLALGGTALLGSRIHHVWPEEIDTAELVLCAVVGGVPHSPGYPLWTHLTGISVGLFPGMHPVDVISWLVVMMAVGAAVLSRGLLRSLGVGVWSATAAAALLICTPICLRALSLPEVHALDLLLFSSSAWAVQRGVKSEASFWTTAGVALAVLAIGHRPVNIIFLAALAFAWGPGLLRSGAGRRGLVFGLVLQALLYLDLWARIQNPDTMWVDETATPGVMAFLRLISGVSFSRFFSWGSDGGAPASTELHMGLQLGALVVASLAAPLVLARRRLGWALMGMSAANLLFVWVYRIPDREFLFFPMIWSGVIVIACAISRLPARLTRPAGFIFMVGVIGLSLVNRRAMDPADPAAWQESLRAVLNGVPEDTVLLSDDWPIRTGLVALREIDGVGNTVDVVRVTMDSSGAQQVEGWLRGQLPLYQLEERDEITSPRPVRLLDTRLRMYLKARGLVVGPAEAGTWSVALPEEG